LNWNDDLRIIGVKSLEEQGVSAEAVHVPTIKPPRQKKQPGEPQENWPQLPLKKQ